MLNIKQRQQNLKTYNYYYKGEIDGIEGPKTKNAYQNFQKDYGLVVDGIYGLNTNNKLLLCVKDLQNILNKYGYNLEIDGIIGNKTLTAIKDFQSRNGLNIDGIVGNNTFNKLKQNKEVSSGSYKCKYFDDSDFKCPCCGLNLQQDEIKQIADEIRDHFGRPTIITSGTRCEKHNKEVGGASNSRHLIGKAIDVYVTGINGQDLLKYCKILVENKKARYTYYISGNACHIDVY